MNAPAKVVMKSTGRSTSSATPTQNAVNSSAPRRPITRAATRAKTKTVIVMTTKRRRGMPERANWERRND